MKITTFIIMAAALHVSAVTMAQKITLSVKNAPLVDVFNQINTQTGYDFLFTSTVIKNSKPVTIDANNEELGDVLQKIFAGQSLDFSIENKSVVISSKDKTAVGNFQKAATVLLGGTVLDKNGHPLVGATIRLKGADNSWTTNRDGQFAIILTDNQGVLQFSFVGYQTKEILVSELRNPVKVMLEESVGTLDDVEILAYGSTTKRFNTGDVVTIGSKEIEKHPVDNVLEALQNQVPGFQIIQNTGNLGGGFSTEIRSGSNIIAGAENPLYIVDGVEYPAQGKLNFMGAISNSATNNPTNLGGNALNYLNPNDIESVSVLKDADATSLYGSRGAYGVVIITTKKGKAGTPGLTANISDGITVTGPLPPLLNTQQYLTLRKEAFVNDGATPGPTDYDLNGTWSQNSYTNWRKYFLGDPGQDERANLTYQGGSDQTTFLMSGTVHNEKSIQRGNGGQIDGDIRMDVSSYSKNKKFFIDLTATYNLSRNNAVPWDFMLDISQAPNAPLPINPDGSLNWYGPSNPAAAENAEYLNTNNNLLGSLTMKYNFTKDLAFNVVLGYSNLADKEFRALPSSYFPPSATSYMSATSTLNTFNNTNTTLDPNLSYTHKFFKNLAVDARTGFTAQEGNQWQLSTTGTNFASDQLLESPTNGSNTPSTIYNSSPNRYLGAFISGRFNWANKYLLSLNGRRDGSTVFGPDHRWGNFGSVAGAWILTEEPWMKSISNVLYFAKVRASYGTTGGDQIGGAYAYLNTFSVGNTPYGGSVGFTPNKIANPDLQWETKKSSELGVTLQFLNGRIEIEGDYYHDFTSDPLYNTAISSVTGFTNVSTNIPTAKLISYGYEAMVTTVNINSKHFRWTTRFNGSIPKSKLIAFPGLVNSNSINLTNPNFRLGKPVTGITLFNYSGVDPQTGEYSFINAKGQKGDFDASTLNPNTDKTQFLDFAPKYYGGIGNNFTYKNLSLDFFFMFTNQMGKNLLGSSNFYPGQFNDNMTTEILKRWRKPGDITNVPVLSQSFDSYFSQNSFVNSTGAYSNATYARLQNLSFTYRFSGKWLDKAAIKSLGIFLRGENLLTISKFKDLDPENLNPNSIGPLKVFTGGINIAL